MARQFTASSSQTLLGNWTTSVSFPFTVAGWVYVQHSGGGLNQILMGIGDFATSKHCTIQIRDSDKRALCQTRNSGGVQTLAVSPPTTNNTWQHVLAKFNSTTSRQCLLNGIGGGIVTTSNDPDVAAWSDVSIGNVQRLSSWTASNYSDCGMAEWAVWDDELTTSETFSLTSGFSPLHVVPHKLKAYWPLLGRSGDSGNEEEWLAGMTLTNSNSPTVTSHPRIIYPNRGLRIVPPAAVAGFSAAWVPRASQLIGAR